ncbi:hypothetical protein SCP_1203000 [Sparassis crispa]|uniref:Uncharacterized protein n=1 Tax=Sparassis crispa TaxID=139825 RepID=A0A401H0W7_9APHY|nr:hypothetical protein SCP_1203000 [Sparassis crispa]GBE88071.1 hypothetical protein SCP_1203000 [Sparassis crispa]
MSATSIRILQTPMFRHPLTYRSDFHPRSSNARVTVGYNAVSDRSRDAPIKSQSVFFSGRRVSPLKLSLRRKRRTTVSDTNVLRREMSAYGRLHAATFRRRCDRSAMRAGFLCLQLVDITPVSQSPLRDASGGVCDATTGSRLWVRAHNGSVGPNAIVVIPRAQRTGLVRRIPRPEVSSAGALDSTPDEGRH